MEEVESCSACYGYLIPALEMLKEEAFWLLDEKSASGRGIVVRRECLVWDTVPVSFRIMWKGVRRWRGIYMSFLWVCWQTDARGQSSGRTPLGMLSSVSG